MVMKIEVEKVMEKLCDYLNQSTMELILSIENEQFEVSAEIRDDIELKIKSTTDLLVNKELTKLDKDEVRIQMEYLRDGFMIKWYEMIGVPKEKQII